MHTPAGMSATCLSKAQILRSEHCVVVKQRHGNVATVFDAEGVYELVRQPLGVLRRLSDGALLCVGVCLLTDTNPMLVLLL